MTCIGGVEMAIDWLYGKKNPNETLIEILQRRGSYWHATYVRDSERAVMRNRWRNRGGFVYLVYFGYEDIYKIGFAQDVEKRVKEFGSVVMSPFEMRIEHVIETDDKYVIESSLHEYFAEKHMRGEWFRLSPEDVAMIKCLQAVHVHDEKANAISEAA
jgi:hypothetical protein